MRSPFPSPKKATNSNFYQTSATKLVLEGLVQFYSKVISPADGPRSPSYPTGSAYGKEAIEEYGFLTGVILIADRLIHESDANLSYYVTIYGTKRYYDPLEFNTYWWDKKEN